MPTRNVNLTKHWDDFVEQGVESGRFSNASEVMREGLRMLEQRQREDAAKLEWLRAAIKEGDDAIARGDYFELNSEAEIDQFFDQIECEVDAKQAATKAKVAPVRRRA